MRKLIVSLKFADVGKTATRVLAVGEVIGEDPKRLVLPLHVLVSDREAKFVLSAKKQYAKAS